VILTRSLSFTFETHGSVGVVDDTTLDWSAMARKDLEENSYIEAVPAVVFSPRVTRRIDLVATAWGADTDGDGLGIKTARMFKRKRNIGVVSVIKVLRIRSAIKFDKRNAMA
jgi:hypothetical protein